MPLYVVQPDRNIEHEGIPYAPSDHVELPPEIAEYHGDNIALLSSDEELKSLEDPTVKLVDSSVISSPLPNIAVEWDE
jgi:hypothetical protein